MAELFYRALALGLSSELPTLCGQLARRSAAKLCHNQVHMTCGSHPLFYVVGKSKSFYRGMFFRVTLHERTT